MSENEFYELQGNAYRGSKYANFVGGGTTPQGNVSSAATENIANRVGTAADAANPGSAPQDAPPTPTTPSPGLTGGMGAPAAPSTGKALAAGALPFAGQAVGQAAGAALGAGASFGTAIGEGFSSLAGKVSGGLIGSTGAGATATNAALGKMGAQFGPATPAAVSSASGGGAGNLGSKANFGGAAGAGIGAAAATLLMGGSVKQAAKTGIGTAAGTAIGNAVGGPIGGFIGGSIGGAIGGRVICTQLVRDGLLDKADQRLDMEFTFNALSNTHVKGYLFWAKPWVEKMKASTKLRDRTLTVVTWRLNEIKYQVGLRDRPDYRGKIVRLIGENICFMIGLFLKDTAETVQYKKGVSHVSATPAG